MSVMNFMRFSFVTDKYQLINFPQSLMIDESLVQYRTKSLFGIDLGFMQLDTKGGSNRTKLLNEILLPKTLQNNHLSK
jgi:hypothetical protein